MIGPKIRASLIGAGSMVLGVAPASAEPAATLKSVPKSGLSPWVSQVRVDQQMWEFTEDVGRLSPGGMSRGDWQRWIKPEAMPADLRNRDLKTHSYYAVDVDANGRVTGCRLLKPSEDVRLDALPCPAFLEMGQFDASYIGPGRAVARKLNISVSWQTMARATYEKAGRAKLAPAPPPPPSAANSSSHRGWPREKWEGGVEIEAFPALQPAYPKAAGRAAGMTSLDLKLDRIQGITGCVIGVSAGHAALDEAACAIARSLSLRYVQPCDFCSVTQIPLQFVWNSKKGSHIRVPLPGASDVAQRLDNLAWKQKNGFAANGYDQKPVGIARDPADQRRQISHADVKRVIESALFPRDFADITGLEGAQKTARIAFDVDTDGRIKRCTVPFSTKVAALDDRICKLWTKRALMSRVEDVFGDPMEYRSGQYVQLKNLLP